MGTYLNPGKDAFQKIVNGEYVDKTGMIALLNRTIGTTKNLACISRPRRFGKSFAAKMLCAYYDCTCDSHLLFDGREIARTEGYTEHLNRYNVICLDITSFISDVKKRRGSLVEIPLVIEEAIRKDMTLNSVKNIKNKLE